jgi:hypothetical protein
MKSELLAHLIFMLALGASIKALLRLAKNTLKNRVTQKACGGHAVISWVRVGKAWISLDSLVRIEHFQWVTQDFR